jgi:hypothetical protein
MWYLKLDYWAFERIDPIKKFSETLIEKRKLVDNGEYRVKSGV